MSTLTESECHAVAIAVDHLLSYVETVDDADEDSPKIRWAIRKLNALLARSGHADWGVLV